MNKITAIIPCKSQSQRIPQKNTKLLNGIPLVEYTINAALESKVFSEIWATSEKLELLQSLPKGVKRHLRPSYLALPTATVVDTCKELLGYLDERFIESFAVLLPTSPLRTAQDIISATELFKKSKTECIMSCTKLDFYPEHMLKICDRNRLHPVSWATIDKKRQDCETRYKHDGSIIICNTKSFLAVDDFYDLDIVPFEIPRERSLDVNDMYDWKLAEYLLRGE